MKQEPSISDKLSKIVYKKHNDTESFIFDLISCFGSVEFFFEVLKKTNSIYVEAVSPKDLEHSNLKDLIRNHVWLNRFALTLSKLESDVISKSVNQSKIGEDGEIGYLVDHLDLVIDKLYQLSNLDAANSLEHYFVNLVHLANMQRLEHNFTIGYTENIFTSHNFGPKGEAISKLSEILTTQLRLRIQFVKFSRYEDLINICTNQDKHGAYNHLPLITGFVEVGNMINMSWFGVQTLMVDGKEVKYGFGISSKQKRMFEVLSKACDVNNI